jgi:RHH-type proline utilization regulon transcriptional repressor/proline dehydrogenase/delta 1-pyrroline-5-carboxylate dehydrogenase
MYSAPESGFSDLSRAINPDYLRDETALVRELAQQATVEPQMQGAIARTAAGLVETVRRYRRERSGLDAFLDQYDLSSAEGVVLMCLAEALLRIPDAETADLLIADRLGAGDWSRHIGESESAFVNASTWGLMLTGRLVHPDPSAVSNPAGFVRDLIAKLGEPVVRSAFRQAMRIMGHQFVMGRTIDEALARSTDEGSSRYRFSFDMLGEAALTAADAQRYANAYRDAIKAVGSAPGIAHDDSAAAPSISIKLSALFPRLEYSQFDRALAEIVPTLKELAETGRQHRVAVTVDAEEADRLELTLAIFQRVYLSPGLKDWDGLGIAVQAYQKRAGAVIRWLDGLSRPTGRRIPVRLVKGAYWDTEIKRAQELGLASYPVYTRKSSTDLAFLACAQQMFSLNGTLLPQFATHNAQTVATIMHLAGDSREYEFQRLHGMGEELYQEIVDQHTLPCRVYAPVGKHEDLLPYLVRRLLENGANTSFVNRIVDDKSPVGEIIADPVQVTARLDSIPHPRIRVPPELFAPERQNSSGVNFSDGIEIAQLIDEMTAARAVLRDVYPIVGGREQQGTAVPSTDPADHSRQVGQVYWSDRETVAQALESASAGFRNWSARPVAERAEMLRLAANLFEQNRGELIALCVSEAGRCIPDASSELREAVDFLRYYASQAERLMADPRQMPGPTGERNELVHVGRGVFACISPWNFPLAIFSGQIAAALVTGNTVLAKPAEQTGLLAGRATALLHEAGIPGDVLHLLPGDGSSVGEAIVSDPRVAGVAFTGSTETAARINQRLAARDAPLAALIAETGGQNAMLVDSSALPEQVVPDVVTSAFNSAGQRCSALRVLFIQEEIAERTLELLIGYMDELCLGDPAALGTDVGPVIDHAALKELNGHLGRIEKAGRLIHRCSLPDGLAAAGSYFAPALVEIPDISVLEREVFGPILHMVRYRSGDLDAVIESINRTGYGLTLGIHSRIENRALAIARTVAVGNVYVNRNMVGAMVGVQPFGGLGLSGTGPKAGGPNYLPRFTAEQTITVNTAAVGGNASLLTLDDD